MFSGILTGEEWQYFQVLTSGCSRPVCLPFSPSVPKLFLTAAARVCLMCPQLLMSVLYLLSCALSSFIWALSSPLLPLLCLFTLLHLCQAALIILCQSINKGSGGHSTGIFPAVSSPVWLHRGPRKTGEKTTGRMIARNISLGPLALGCSVETA